MTQVCGFLLPTENPYGIPGFNLAQPELMSVWTGSISGWKTDLSFSLSLHRYMCVCVYTQHIFFKTTDTSNYPSEALIYAIVKVQWSWNALWFCNYVSQLRRIYHICNSRLISSDIKVKRHKLLKFMKCLSSWWLPTFLSFLFLK